MACFQVPTTSNHWFSSLLMFHDGSTYYSSMMFHGKFHGSWIPVLKFWNGPNFHFSESLLKAQLVTLSHVTRLRKILDSEHFDTSISFEDMWRGSTILPYRGFLKLDVFFMEHPNIKWMINFGYPGYPFQIRKPPCPDLWKPTCLHFFVFQNVQNGHGRSMANGAAVAQLAQSEVRATSWGSSLIFFWQIDHHNIYIYMLFTKCLPLW